MPPKSKVKCVNPYGVHQKNIHSNLRYVNESDVKLSPTLGIKVGDMWCNNCRLRLRKENASTSTYDESVKGVSESLQQEPVIEPEDSILDIDFSSINVPAIYSPKIIQTPPDSAPCSQETLLNCLFYHEKSSCSTELKVIVDMPHQEQRALSWMSGIWVFETNNMICSTHYSHFIAVYKPTGDLETGKCCDPLKCHKAPVKFDLREISIVSVMKAKDRGISLKAGEMFCKNCRSSIFELPQKENEEPLSQGSLDLPASGSSAGSPSVQKETVSQTLKLLGVSPLSVTARSRLGRIQEGKRKLEDVTEKVQKRVCSALDLNFEELQSSDTYLGKEYHLILSSIKEKLKTAESNEKYQLLTLCPLSWKISYAAKFFDVSPYFITRAREIRETKGILCAPSFDRPGKVPEEIKDKVITFYCSDENSRAMPGMKDYLSVGKNQHKQKRLLLFNLKDLHRDFQDNPSLPKLGFSLFSSLRPKWCVLAGQPGTHKVCVCQTHQDVKLLLHSLNIKDHYRTFIEAAVCNLHDRSCMLGLCPKCCSLQELTDLFHGRVCAQFQALDSSTESIEDFLNETVKYTQWKTTDRAELVTHLDTRQEIIEITAKKFKILIPHDFVAKQQSTYFKNFKLNLNEETVAVQMDFSMNYSCTVQDEIQSYHWSKKQATVHPVVIYHVNSEGSTSEYDLCFISDDLNHDFHLVEKIQEETIKIIKEKFPSVKRIEYFSDGCASQYKNKRMFYHLCQHANKKRRVYPLFFISYIDRAKFTLQNDWVKKFLAHNKEGEIPCQRRG